MRPRLLAALAASALVHALAMSAMLVPDAHAAPPSTAAPPSRKASPVRYYRRSELDAAPAIMTRVKPEYPDMARVSGKVVLRLFIDERGTVENVAVLRAEPPGVFDASARRAFLAARFTPGMKAGVPVKAQLTLQVDYSHPR